jgi:hypothetical protein
MYKYLFRFSVTTLTILTANLITSVLSDYLTGYRHSASPLRFTMMAMVIIVAVFYPLFMKMEAWVTVISVNMIRTGKSLWGRYLGLMLTFIIAMAVLVYLYARMWYSVDILRLLLEGEAGSLF